LQQNTVPTNPSGKRHSDLDYEGSSDDEFDRLNDEHVQELCHAMLKNDVFSGPLDLSKNNLTDQVSYNLETLIFWTG